MRPKVDARPVKKKREPPFPFVLDAIEALEPRVKAFFGGWGVYVGEKIVLILWEKSGDEDSGVWLATVREHHESLGRDLPSMRSIAMFSEGGPSGWQVLPAESDAFEEDVLRACAMIRKGDERIGKVPKPRRRRMSGPRGGAKKARHTK
jgi:hypothetical protein